MYWRCARGITNLATGIDAVEWQAGHPDAAYVDDGAFASYKLRRERLDEHQWAKYIDFVHTEQLLGVSVEQRAQALHPGLLPLALRAIVSLSPMGGKGSHVVDEQVQAIPNSLRGCPDIGGLGNVERQNLPRIPLDEFSSYMLEVLESTHVAALAPEFGHAVHLDRRRVHAPSSSEEIPGHGGSERGWLGASRDEGDFLPRHWSLLRICHPHSLMTGTGCEKPNEKYKNAAQ